MYCLQPAAGGHFYDFESITRYTVHGRGAKHSLSLPSVCADSTRCPKRWSHVRLRQIEEHTQKAPYPTGSGGQWRVHFFVSILKKVVKLGSEKGSLNRPIPLLNFVSSDPVLKS